MKHAIPSFLARSTVLVMLLVATGLSAVPLVRVQLHKQGTFIDETVLYYQDGATPGFDSEFDAYKLLGPNPAPMIAQIYQSTRMTINGIHPPAASFSIDLLVKTPISGHFTITAADFSELPAGTALFLLDRVSGTTTPLFSGPYAFFLADTTSSPRFVLTVRPPQTQTVSCLDSTFLKKREHRKGVQVCRGENQSFKVRICKDHWTEATLTVATFPEHTIAYRRALTREANERMVQSSCGPFQPGVYILSITFRNGEEVREKVVME